MNGFPQKGSFVWAVADLLHGDFKQSEYGRVILPFLVLRQLDQVLAPTRAILKAAEKHPPDSKKSGSTRRSPTPQRSSGSPWRAPPSRPPASSSRRSSGRA